MKIGQTHALGLLNQDKLRLHLHQKNLNNFIKQRDVHNKTMQKKHKNTEGPSFMPGAAHINVTRLSAIDMPAVVRSKNESL